MHSDTVSYEFSQKFEFPARDEFEWCTDCQSDEWERMGKKGTRKIRHINEDTLILTDWTCAESIYK